jgi:D-tyrosyl-tRNA(Tyr) deacylase
MRVLVQKVKTASCRVNQEIISEIQHGFLLFTGFTHTDTLEEVKYMAKKVANLRIFEDQNGKLNESILDHKGSILHISQFTLYGDAAKGNRPSFTMAMEPQKAEKLYHYFTELLVSNYHIPTKVGQFGEHMDIELINDGPVTILLEREAR